ncbi:MAG: type II toxin-antitoxin system HicB family antitoxin [Selenomonadaceae bacterium]|nr:type II toxin-antitoxin system HicB family antitoxin [Selenomonadaceae bacterium]
MKCIYPAIFAWVESDKVYSVKFPDIAGCFTYGENLTEAMENAADVLNLMLWDVSEKDLPPATKLEDIQLPDAKSFAQYIFADTDAYKKFVKFVKRMEQKKIKKAEKFSKTA